MVMKKNMMRRNLWRSIRKSMGRYIAIMSIIALGAGLFVGLLSSKISMMETARNYMDSQNMYDLTLLNDYGWSIEQVEAVKELPQVVDVEGTVYVDVIGTVGDSQTEAVYEVYSIPQEVNQLYLLEGRMPEAPNECLADANLQDSTDLNDQFRIADTNEEETLDSFQSQWTRTCRPDLHHSGLCFFSAVHGHEPEQYHLGKRLGHFQHLHTLGCL